MAMPSRVRMRLRSASNSAKVARMLKTTIPWDLWDHEQTPQAGVLRLWPLTCQRWRGRLERNVPPAYSVPVRSMSINASPQHKITAALRRLNYPRTIRSSDTGSKATAFSMFTANSKLVCACTSTSARSRAIVSLPPKVVVTKVSDPAGSVTST